MHHILQQSQIQQLSNILLQKKQKLQSCIQNKKIQFVVFHYITLVQLILSLQAKILVIYSTIINYAQQNFIQEHQELNMNKNKTIYTHFNNKVVDIDIIKYNMFIFYYNIQNIQYQDYFRKFEHKMEKSSAIQTFSDQTIFQLSKTLYLQLKDQQEEQKLDKHNLQQIQNQQIKPLYPMKSILQHDEQKLVEYTCKEYCCSLNPGSFICGKSKPGDQVYKQFGLGFSLYVKFLKHITCFLFFVALLALIPVIFYYIVGSVSGFGVTESVNKLIFSSTIGIMSQSFSRCQYSHLQDEGQTYSVSFYHSCFSGNHRFLGIAYTNNTLNSVYNCRIQRQFSQFIQQSDISPAPKNDVSTEQQLQFFIPKKDGEQAGKYAVYIFQCINNSYQSGNNQLYSSGIIISAIIIDLVIIVIFIAFLISEKQCEKKQIINFKIRDLSIQDFAVQLHGFTLENIQKQIDNFVKKYSWEDSSQQNRLSGSNEDISFRNNQFYENIVQIKIPQSEQLRKAIQKRRNQYKKLQRIMHKYIFKKQQHINTGLTTQKQFIQKYFNNDPESQQYKSYKYKLSSSIKNLLKYKKIQYKANKKTPYPLYIVMSNPGYKNKIMNNRQKRIFHDTIQVDHQTYQISDAPAPQMILWKNYHKNTVLRVIFVWFLTLLICLGSYILVGLAIYGRDTLLKNNFSFNNDCLVPYTLQQLQNFQNSLSNNQQYISCYCQQQFLSNPTELEADCLDWVQNYTLLLGIPILISLGVVIYNLLISRFFRVMTKFECHKTVTAQLYSYVIKRAFILIMNMGLIVLILQLKFQNFTKSQDFVFLFSGTFTDISSDWYLRIGSIIVLTLSFNIFIPVLQMMFLAILKFFRRLWDRRCCRQTSQTTKDGYIKLYTNNQFPIEERYADIIAILAISLTFSAVIPISYIICFLSFGFMYLCDKILLFKVYKKPLNYSADLHRQVFKTIYFFLMIHCFSSLFLLSQQGIIEASGVQNMYQIPGNDQRFQSLVQIPYFIPYIAIFVILFLFALLNHTILRLIKRCKYKDNKQQSLKNIRSSTDLFSILTPYHREQLKLALTKQKDVMKSHIQGQSPLKLVAIVASKLRMSHMREEKNVLQSICDRTINRLNQLENISRRKQRQKQEQNRTKLIGLPGYQEMLDGAKFTREKKIQLLDKLCSKIVGKQFYIKSKALKRSDSAHNFTVDLDNL